MSFLSVLGTIGKDVLAGVNAAAPLGNLFIPGIGNALQGVTGLIIAAENHPDLQGAGMGAQKKAYVLDAIQLGLPFFQSILKENGILLTIDSQALSDVIDETVALFNSAKKLHDSFSITQLQAATK